MEKLDWLPLYIDKLLSSPAWNDMQDYQRGWYIQLLLRSTRSTHLGYLPLDGQLWRLAGARSGHFWFSQNAAVLACFKVRQFDGQDWIYNERLLSVMEEQSGKYYRKKKPQSNSPDSFDLEARDKCGLHPDSGLTNWGTCWECSKLKYSQSVEANPAKKAKKA